MGLQSPEAGEGTLCLGLGRVTAASCTCRRWERSCDRKVGRTFRGMEVLLDLAVTGSHGGSGSQRARDRVVWEVAGCQWGSRLDL